MCKKEGETGSGVREDSDFANVNVQGAAAVDLDLNQESIAPAAAIVRPWWPGASSDVADLDRRGPAGAALRRHPAVCGHEVVLVGLAVRARHHLVRGDRAHLRAGPQEGL